VKFKALTDEHNALKRDYQLLKKQHDQERNLSGAASLARGKDDKQRALEEENDLLKYNNERLTKRVMVLQDSVTTSQVRDNVRCC
jgi:hypothetical protein